MKLLILGVLCLAGCSTEYGDRADEVTLYPADYGALANDGVDDSTFLRTMIDDACDAAPAVIRLGIGTYDISKAGPGAYNLRAALSWHCPGVSLEGDSMYGTVIRLTGDMGHSASWPISLDPGAAHGRLSRFTVNTAGTYNEDESSHAVSIGSSICAGAMCSQPVEDFTVTEVAVIHPPPSDATRKGDCFHVWGNTEAAPAKNIKFINVNGMACARSFLGMQRNADDIWLVDSYGNGEVGDTWGDGEATGGGWQHGLVIQRNIVEGCHSNYCLALTSTANCNITDNIFVGKGINLFRGTDCVFANNSIDAIDMLAGVAVFDIGNQAERIAVTGGTMRRRGQSGSLIKVRPASGGFATGVTINGVAGTNETDGASIFLDSVRVTTVGSNALSGNHGPNSMGVYVTAGGRDVQTLVVTSNAIDNMGYAGMRLDPTPLYTFRGVTVGLNAVTNSGPGLRCDDPTLWPAGSLTRGLNNYNTAEVCAVP